MKMKSRIVSILLAVAMVLTYMPALAFAEGESLTDTEKNSSYGFFVWLSENAATASEKEDAAIAAQIISNTLTAENKSKVFNDGTISGGSHSISYNDLLATVELGGENDATSLDNLRAAVDFISSGNSYRAKESLPALKVSSALMAMAELNVDYQDKNVVFDHSDVFYALENLAYHMIGGTSNDIEVSGGQPDNPYTGWYTEEKENYDSNNGKATGHYKTLTDRKGAMLLTGFGVRSRYVTEQLEANDGNLYDCLMHDRYYSQTFSTKSDMYDVGDGVTPDTYLAYIDEYKSEVGVPTEKPVYGTRISGMRFDVVDNQAILFAVEKIDSTIEIPSKVTFDYVDGSGSVEYPVEAIKHDTGVFCFKKDLKSVTLPDTLKTIGKDSFLSTGLSSIVIPSSVTEIGEHAFGFNLDLDTNKYNPVEGFIIYGTPGTEAEAYAKRSGITFEDVKNKPAEEQTTDPQTSDDQQGNGQNTDTQTPSDQQGSEQKPDTQTPSDQQGSEQKPDSQTPSGQQGGNQTPDSQTPSDQQGSGQQPDTQTPSSQQGSGQQPAAQTPSGQQGSGQQPSTQTPSGQQPSTQTPSSQQPAAQTPVAEVTSGTPEVTLSATDFTYKFAVKKVKVGKKKKKMAVATVQVPTVVSVKLNGKALTAADYDVSFSNAESSELGKYTVTVTLKGKYNGTGTAIYNINPKPAKISKPAKGKKKMTVKWKKAAKNDITYKALDGYEIQYSLSPDFSSADTRTTTASKKAKSKAIKKLQGKQTYYVRIRTYKNAGGAKLYSDWSAVKSVAVK